MSFRRPWVWLVVIGALLAACAWSLDSFRSDRCDERGGQWGVVDGTRQCVDQNGKPR
jgi:hypothetical protein